MVRTILFFVVTLAGCGGAWPVGQVCDQRFRIQFAGIESGFAQPDCADFDFDNDRVSARYDQDDRLNRYDADEGIDGSNIGEIPDCRIAAEDTGNGGNGQYTPKPSPVYNEECIQDFWTTQLVTLCDSWGSGDMTPFEADNIDAEESAASEYCSK